MRLFVLFFLFSLFFSGALSAQPEMYFSDSIAVMPDNNFSNRAPRIALLEDGRPVVYWGKANTSTLYLAIWETDGFGSPIALNTGNIDPDLWSGGLGPQLTSFENNIYLIFEDYGHGVYLIRSNDGGATFENPVEVTDLAPGRIATLPSIETDSQGNPIVSFITTNEFELEALYEVAVSNDGGATFEPSIAANLSVLSGEVCECCPASVNIQANDEILLAFRNNEDNIRDIWVTKSSDGGMTYPDFADIDDTDWFLQSCPNNGPASMIAGDSLITAYYSGGGGFPRVYVSTLHIPTMTKGVQMKMPTLNGDEQFQNYPRIAGNLDTVGVVWQERAGVGNDIMMAYSVEGASGLIKKTVTAASGTLSQNFPDIAFKNGLFHLVWEDGVSGQVWYRTAGFEPFTDTKETELSEGGFRIFPNPTENNVNIISENFEIEKTALFNLNGQLILDKNTNGKVESLNLNGLETGVYLLKIYSEEKVFVERVMRF